jgi:transcriptional regulator with XRE-family HTH domain
VLGRQVKDLVGYGVGSIADPGDGLGQCQSGPLGVSEVGRLPPGTDAAKDQLHYLGGNRQPWPWAIVSSFMGSGSAGTLVREWRVRRHRSQMDLALEVGVSPRHLSFVETGRSKASPELLLALAEHLDVPLRERNGLLLAGGYAPRFSRAALDSAEMERVLLTLQQILAGHDPYPGIVIDRYWNIILANASAGRMMEGLPEHLTGPVANVFRLSLHPEGLARRTLNFEEWARYLLGQLHRSARLTGDEVFEGLVAEITEYPNLSGLDDWHTTASEEEPELLVPFRMDLGETELSLFTTITVFGTPQDVTLSELAVELFYPADQPSELWLRRAGSPLPKG